jgi:hypothetical protein
MMLAKYNVDCLLITSVETMIVEGALGEDFKTFFSFIGWYAGVEQGYVRLCRLFHLPFLRFGVTMFHSERLILM